MDMATDRDGTEEQESASGLQERTRKLATITTVCGVNKSREVAYAIANALQKKFKDSVVAVASECIGKEDRLLFSYKLRAVDQVAETAYSEGFFEGVDSAQVNWLAKRIYEELNQRIKWKKIAKARTL